MSAACRECDKAGAGLNSPALWRSYLASDGRAAVAAPGCPRPAGAISSNRCRSGESAKMPTISPCLWFDDEAEAAANFYVSVFPNSRILGIKHYVEGLPRPAGSVMTLRARRRGIRRPERRSAVQVFASHLVRRQMRDGAGCRPLLAAIDRRRQRGPLRLADRPLRRVVADRPAGLLDLQDKPDTAAAQRAVAVMLGMGRLDLVALQRA